MIILMCLFMQVSDHSTADILARLLASPGEIESFVAKQGELPVVHGTDVLFLIKSEQGAPRLISDHNDTADEIEQSGEVMKPFPGSSWYYLTAKLEPGARVEYRLLINGKWSTDPHNPRSHKTWGQMMSEVRLLPIEPNPELTMEPAARGSLVSQEFTSKVQDNKRKMHVYLPPGYDKGNERYPVAYFNDGSMFAKSGRVPQVLDYLISKGLMKPVIGVFTDPVNRRSEYRMNPKFREMMTTELIPMVDATWRTRANRDDRLMVGASRGGLCATDLVAAHPDLFAMCATFAPALNSTDMLEKLEDAKGNVSFFVLGCLYDPPFFPDSPALRDMLTKKGWPNAYHVVPEGHNLIAWSGHMDKILLHFFGV